MNAILTKGVLTLENWESKKPFGLEGAAASDQHGSPWEESFTLKIRANFAEGEGSPKEGEKLAWVTVFNPSSKNQLPFKPEYYTAIVAGVLPPLYLAHKLD